MDYTEWLEREFFNFLECDGMIDFEDNPDAIPKFKEWVTSKFGTLPGDQPEIEEELKELSQPVGTPIKTWENLLVWVKELKFQNQ